MAELEDSCWRAAMSADDYHGADGISKSDLDLFAVCPARYRYLKDNPQERKASDAMTLGTLLHTMILEPHLIDERYYVAAGKYPKGRRSSIDRKRAEEDAAGRTVLWDEPPIECALAVTQHEGFRNLLGGAPKIEEAHFWRSDSGLLRCRVDALNEEPERPVVIDLKSTQSAEPGSFARDARRYRLHVQAAMYRDIVERTTGRRPVFAFVAVEKTPPYPVEVYHMGEDWITEGRATYLADLERLNECLKTNKWPTYNTTAVTPLPYAPSRAT